MTNREMKQTFETMDWENEAKRVTAAFGVQHLCQFEESEFGVYILKLVDVPDSMYEEYPKIGDAELSVEYTAHYRYFSLERFHANIIGMGATEVMLHNDGTIRRIQRNDRYAAPMAEALFCLGLLTPEIKAALEVTITGHEKIRLALEFDSRISPMSE